MNHNFGREPFTIGIEEELMLIDPETLELAQGIETVLAEVGDQADGQVKPELMQSVLEIATEPCPNVGAAGAQLERLRSVVRAAADRGGMLLGASGTHPSALWEEQRIVDRPRYRALTAELGYIARRELIFGTHVHVGVDGPDKAVYIADGLRRDLPLLLALSANSPLWRGRVTGMMSSRTPVFRAFPRVGVPPHYGSWEIYERRVERMVSCGAISDYTYLWWDVRPHPNLGTVEVRVFDQQTRLEHTVALAAVVVALVHRYASGFVEGQALIEVPGELIDDNKVRAALHGLEGELVDYRRGRNVATRELVARLLEELGPHADELGCGTELGAIHELIEAGTGARHQLDLLERDGDLGALTRHLCAETAGAS